MRKEKEFDWKAILEENLRTGYSELLILQLLSEKDMYGYELTEEILARTDKAFYFTEGAMYLTLIRMHTRGLVSQYRQIVTGKRFRTYYHLEEFGKQYLEYGKKQWLSIYGTVSKILKTEADDHDEQ